MLVALCQLQVHSGVLGASMGPLLGVLLKERSRVRTTQKGCCTIIVEPSA